jgi:hypothetical protein
MIRGKNGLSEEIFLLLFEGNLREVLQGFLCKYILAQESLAFVARSCVAALGV